MRCLLVIVAVLAGVTAASSSAATPHGPLTGTWKGALNGTVNGVAKQEKIVFTINGAQNAGTWKVSASCHGTLTLDSISNGYHHYKRHAASGSACSGGGGGGDVDCLMRDGANVYDSVTPRSNGWGRSGTLHRVSTK